MASNSFRAVRNAELTTAVSVLSTSSMAFSSAYTCPSGEARYKVRLGVATLQKSGDHPLRQYSIVPF